MKTFQGIAASSGLAIGEAMVIDNGKCRINRRFISPSEVEAEVNRFRVALEAAQKQIALNRDSVIQELGKEYGQIFEAIFRFCLIPVCKRNWKKTSVITVIPRNIRPM